MVMRIAGRGAPRTSSTTKPASFSTGSDSVFKPAPTQAGSSAAFTPGGVGGGIQTPSATPYPARVPQAPRAPAPAAPSAPSPRYSPGMPIAPSSTGSYSAAPPAPMAAPEPVSPMSEQDWVGQDSSYLTEKGGIDAELANLLEQLKAQRANYDADFGEGLDNLGWEGDPLGQGSWDRDDPLSAYGQAHKGQTEDFAGRNMLTSSFYTGANEELNNRFNEQRNDMLGGRQRQMSAWDMEQSQGQSRAQQAMAQAMASSYARRAAQYGLG